jgi:hypothetical protein
MNLLLNLKIFVMLKKLIIIKYKKKILINKIIQD